MSFLARTYAWRCCTTCQLCHWWYFVATIGVCRHVQAEANEWIWYSSMLGQRSMAYTTVTCFWRSSYCCHALVTSRTSSLSSSNTAHQMCETTSFLQRNTLAFISHSLLYPNSRDLINVQHELGRSSLMRKLMWVVQIPLCRYSCQSKTKHLLRFNSMHILMFCLLILWTLEENCYCVNLC